MPENTPAKKHIAIISLLAALIVGVLLFLGGIPGPAQDRNARAAGTFAVGWMGGWSTDEPKPPGSAPQYITNANTLWFTNANPAGPGWVSLGSAGVPRYGLEFVDVNPSAQFGEVRGTLHGYAWTPNLGWISFESGDVAGCPEAPCEPQVVSLGGSDYIFRGWARVVAIRDADQIPAPGGGFVSNSGGYKGWIRLSSPPGAVCPPFGTPPGPTGCPYGVRVSNGTFPQDSYAWSNEFGWLRFRGQFAIGGAAASPSCSIAANPAERRVSLANPIATSLLTWYCSSVVLGSCRLSWNKPQTTVDGIANGGSVQEAEASGVQTRFSTSTMYTIRCDSAVLGQPAASANTFINVIYPSGIIEVPGF